MKYQDWLNLQLDNTKEISSMVSVPVNSLESLLEDRDGLEGYVKYLQDSNEYLSNAVKFYRDLSDQLKNKGENNGP